MGLLNKLFKKGSQESLKDTKSSNNTALDDLEGYSVKRTYENVNVCIWDGVIPEKTKSDNRIVFIQEKTNAADPKAVLLLLVPQKRKLGYLYRGSLQDMVNDYLDRGDKVTARISHIVTGSYPSVSIDIAFYKKNK